MSEAVSRMFKNTTVSTVFVECNFGVFRIHYFLAATNYVTYLYFILN